MIEKTINKDIKTFEDYEYLNNVLLLCIDCSIQEMDVLKCIYKYLSEKFSEILSTNAKNGNKVYLNFLRDMKLIHLGSLSEINGDTRVIDRIDELLKNKYKNLITPTIFENLNIRIEASREALIELKKIKDLNVNLNVIRKNLFDVIYNVKNNKKLNTPDKIFNYINNEWKKIIANRINYKLLNEILVNGYYSIPESGFDQSGIDPEFVRTFYKEYFKNSELTKENNDNEMDSNIISLELYRKNKKD